MAETQKFQVAFPYQQDVLVLPVTDLDTTSDWYSKRFGMVEVERHDNPVPTVILERDRHWGTLTLLGGWKLPTKR